MPQLNLNIACWEIITGSRDLNSVLKELAPGEHNYFCHRLAYRISTLPMEGGQLDERMSRLLNQVQEGMRLCGRPPGAS